MSASRWPWRSSQRLDVVVSSAPPAREDTEPSPSPADTPPAETAHDGYTRWRQGNTGLQTTATWVIGALAAVGVTMFAKGFITTPQLDWHDDVGRLLLAWVLGVAGVAGVVLLIWATSRILTPPVITMSTLPDDFVARVDADPGAHLPPDEDSVASFRATLMGYANAVYTYGEEVRLATSRLKAATPGERAAAQRDLDAAEGRYRLAVHNHGVYVQVRRRLLEEAQFRRSTRQNKPMTWAVIIGALAAAGGGLGYQLVLSTPPADSEDSAPAEASATFPRPAHLRRLDGDSASAALWQAVGLAPCETVQDGARGVPVFLLSGEGTSSSPYSVTTIPTSACPQRTFPVISDVAAVVEPSPTQITFTPRPSASPSATRR